MQWRCWVDGQKEKTLATVEAPSMFDARQQLATRYGLKTYQIIAVKVKQ